MQAMHRYTHTRLHNQQALSSSIEEGLKMQAMHRYIHTHTHTRLHNQQALSSSIEEGLKMQAMHRAQRVRKHQHESDNTTFSGGEENCDSRSHVSNPSVHSTPQEPGPSRKRSHPSEDSGAEPDLSHEGGGRSPETPGGGEAGSEIELVFRAHPLLVEKDGYSQTR
ncbi:hypothetical protein FKM82_025348 [Ascaphus truei]